MMGYFSMALFFVVLASRVLGLLCNGDFEQYGLVYNGSIAWSYLNSNYTCWYNSIGEHLEVKIFNSLTSTVVELSHDYPYVLCQDVQLQPTGVYQLNFSVYNSDVIITSSIYLKIDGVPVFNHTTSGPSVFSNASGNFTANYKKTQICFDSVFTVSLYSLTMAPCLDNITIVLLVPPIANFTNTVNSSTSPPIQRNQTGITLNQNFLQAVSAGLSIPTKLAASLRSSYLLLDDIWLYDYSQKNDTGMLDNIFRTIASIQLLKFQYLEKYIGFGKYKNWIGISDYRNYSYPRFVEIEDSSSVFIDSNFSFLVYSLPQNILVCLTLCLLFHLLWKYRISKFVRKFYFIKTVLAIAVFEQNLSYFIFVCLLNTNHSFTFVLMDKISFCFTIIFLFCLTIFTFCFYPLLFKYLRKQAGHFADFTYREIAGFWYRSVQMARNVLRAVLFCFFHRQFLNQMIALSLVEVLMISVSISTESLKRIFISRSMYSCHLIYYFLFIMFNLALYAVEQTEDELIQNMIKQYEEIILYCLVIVAILMMLVDMLPLGGLKIITRKQFQQEFFAAGKHKSNTKVQASTKQISSKIDPPQNQGHKIKIKRQKRRRKQFKNNFLEIEKKAMNLKLKQAGLEVQFTYKNKKIERKRCLYNKRVEE